ncbi:hypothetical protein QQS21_000055 [Conoideocrella luteorostrata]|uniref:ABC transmembrane type-1 domain-containing protein n=1 Tax=Conoideocrella luteorostrata TaxID=1105319 RepID=A0AAJ0CZI7_9HYPO|nr:hypothetical protein QQS21_000055 [Conoideocrella luteorostrata]
MGEQRVLWRPSSIIFMCCLAGGITYPALAVLLSKSLEAYETTDVTKTNSIALMFFVVALGNLAVYSIIDWLSNIVAQIYCGDVFSSTLQQDMSFFDEPENGTGALVSRLASEPTSLQELLPINISHILICVVNLISSYVLAIIYGWKLGLALTCGTLPVIVGSGYMRIRLESKFKEDTVERYATSNAMASEAVMGIRTISSLALERTVVERYKKSLQGILVSAAEYTSSQVYTVYLSVVFSSEAAAISFQHTTNISKASTAISYIFRLRRDRISSSGEDDADFQLDPATEDLRGMEIVFENVHFSYPLRPEQQVLQKINISITSGKVARCKFRCRF